MTVYAISTQATVAAVTALLSERGWSDAATVRSAGPGKGPALLEEAARVPADLLLLDLDTGPGLGMAVVRYRLARPETRVVLLAPGRKPGDAEVAAVVAAGVYDVIDDLGDLDSVVDHPQGLAAAARWLALGSPLDANVKPGVLRWTAAVSRSRTGNRTPTVDRLTGLPEREQGERALNEVLASGQGAAVVFIDFDGFKQINDTQGHAEGDRVLREAAKMMRGALRRDDLLCRWGGDEFVLVMPGADLITAQETADRLRDAVSGIIGISAGVAVSRPGDTPDSLVDRADKAMYANKRAQREEDWVSWPVFQPSTPPAATVAARREPEGSDWPRAVARGGVAAVGVTISLVRLAAWLGALVLLGIVGLRLLSMFNEMQRLWRVMLP